MILYNNKISHEIEKILTKKIKKTILVHIICDFMWRYIYLKIPFSIKNALIDLPVNYVNVIDLQDKKDNINFINIRIRENKLPEHLIYIGSSDTIEINIDLSGPKHIILKSILQVHTDCNIDSFNIKSLKLFLKGTTRYKIIIPTILQNNKIYVPDHDYNIINSNDFSLSNESYVDISILDKSKTLSSSSCKKNKKSIDPFLSNISNAKKEEMQNELEKSKTDEIYFTEKQSIIKMVGDKIVDDASKNINNIIIEYKCSNDIINITVHDQNI